MILLDGKVTSSFYLEKIKQEASNLYTQYNKKPHLVAILVGNDGASQTYVQSKIKNCEKIGFNSTVIKYKETISQNELINKIKELNTNKDINGIIVQLPLPNTINANEVILTITPEKDVDGFHPINIGKLFYGMDGMIPATPYGMSLFLEKYNIDTEGKKCVIVGRSNIVGKPMSLLMSLSKKYSNSTVTLCHSKTKNLEKEIIQADILVAATGIPKMIKGNMVKENVVVLDVGITRVSNKNSPNGFRLVGDVDFDEVSKKASYITPVPGGVGLMTIVGLLTNTLKAFKNSLKTE